MSLYVYSSYIYTQIWIYVDMFTYIHWLVVWNMNFIFPYILGTIIPIDKYCSDGFKPPTSNIYIYMSLYVYSYILMDVDICRYMCMYLCMCIGTVLILSLVKILKH